MFTRNDLLVLLAARPFVPFRLHMSDGGTIDIPSREVVLPGRHQVLVGLLDPDATDTAFERWTVIWYLHVTRVEQLRPGAPPFSSPDTPTESVV